MLEAQVKGGFADAPGRAQQQLLGFFEQRGVQVLLRALAGVGAQHVAQVGRRHVQSLGKVLHAGQRLLGGAVQVSSQQVLEAAE